LKQTIGNISSPNNWKRIVIDSFLNAKSVFIMTTLST